MSNIWNHIRTRDDLSKDMEDICGACEGKYGINIITGEIMPCEVCGMGNIIPDEDWDDINTFRTSLEESKSKALSFASAMFPADEIDTIPMISDKLEQMDVNDEYNVEMFLTSTFEHPLDESSPLLIAACDMLISNHKTFECIELLQHETHAKAAFISAIKHRNREALKLISKYVDEEFYNKCYHYYHGLVKSFSDPSSNISDIDIASNLLKMEIYGCIDGKYVLMPLIKLDNDLMVDIISTYLQECSAMDIKNFLIEFGFSSLKVSNFETEASLINKGAKRISSVVRF